MEYELYKKYNCHMFGLKSNRDFSSMAHFLWVTKNVMLCSTTIPNVPGNFVYILHLGQTNSNNVFIEMLYVVHCF